MNLKTLLPRLANRYSTWLRLRVDCAWCHRHLRGNRFAHVVSHGICPHCRAHLQTEIKSMKHDAVSSIQAAASVMPLRPSIR